MYVALSVLFSLIFLCFAVSHFFITDKKWALINKRISLIFGIAGLASALLFLILFFVRTSSYTDGDKEWAREVILGYLWDVLPVLGIVLAILILSAVFQPKMRVMRIIVTFAYSVFVLVFGYISSFLSYNDSVSVTFYIYALSISFAVMTQFCTYFDFGRLYEKLDGEKIKKKNKNR